MKNHLIVLFDRDNNGDLRFSIILQDKMVSKYVIRHQGVCNFGRVKFYLYDYPDCIVDEFSGDIEVYLRGSYTERDRNIDLIYGFCDEDVEDVLFAVDRLNALTDREMETTQ